MRPPILRRGVHERDAHQKALPMMTAMFASSRALAHGRSIGDWGPSAHSAANRTALKGGSLGTVLLVWFGGPGSGRLVGEVRA